METYRSFVKMLLRNYFIGSLTAVFGIGGVFIFFTIKIAPVEKIYVVGTLTLALLVMLGSETLTFRRHLRPIARVFQSESPALEELRSAYMQVHRFPFLAVKRILGPHLCGFAVPGFFLTLVEIHFGLITFPQRLVWMALGGALLIGGMHAMIEFYMTSNTLGAMLTRLHYIALDLHSVDLSLEGQVLVTIRRKYTLSTLMIGTFPLLLFSFATEVRLAQVTNGQTLAEYWKWAGLILLLGIAFAWFCANLMSRAVQEPIHQLQDLMAKIQAGRFNVRAEDSYSDEFSQLVAGFNHMVKGLSTRDELNNQLLDSYFRTLAAALDARDPYTAGHSLRVAHYSVQIGRSIGMNPQELDLLNKSALLHDIGKIGIRDDVLLKEGKLTEAEFAQIKMHPVLGEAILLQIQPVEAMAPLLPGVRSHHERYDGHGYPDGLVAENIPLLGRIIAVADAFDAMTSDRPYRQGMPMERALTILHEGKGAQWDPEFARHFIEWVRRQEGPLFPA